MTTMPGTPIPSLTPETLRVLDPNGKWQSTGALNSSSNGFMPTATGAVDVTSFGMKPGGQDNSPFVKTLMKAIGSNTFLSPGPKLYFQQFLDIHLTIIFLNHLR